MDLKNAYVYDPDRMIALIGMGENQEPILFDFTDNYHLFIGGMQGCGKSTMLHTILQSLMRQHDPTQMRIVYCDPKQVDAAIYDKSKFVFQTSTDVLQDLKNEVDRRLSLLARCHFRSTAEYNLEQEEKIPDIFVCIDLLSHWLKDEMFALFWDLFSSARAAGIHFIITENFPARPKVMTIIKAIQNKILYPVSASQAKSIFETSEIKPPQEFGHIVCVFSGEASIHGEACTVDTDAVRKAAMKYGDASFETEDYLLPDAIQYAASHNNVTAIDLQREFKIGFARAFGLMEVLLDEGYVQPASDPTVYNSAAISIEAPSQPLSTVDFEVEILPNETVDTDSIQKISTEVENTNPPKKKKWKRRIGFGCLLPLLLLLIVFILLIIFVPPAENAETQTTALATIIGKAASFTSLFRQ